MRQIDTHRVNPANDQLVLQALDEPGSGGANHHYCITGFSTRRNPSIVPRHDETLITGRADIVFQNGPIAEAGVNGLTHEVLLAILIDRLEAFQRGPFSNEYNHYALHHLRNAQSSLQKRTRDRMARGVEGTHTV